MENQSPQKPLNETESEIRTLPDDVIFQMILPRLPVKPLTQFKSVSKYWLSTISSNEFAKTHLKFSSSSTPKSFIFNEIYSLKGNYGEYLSFDESFNNMKECVDLEEKFQKFSLSGITDKNPRHILGSSNGLLCLFDVLRLHYLLWNPVTKECHNTRGPTTKYASPGDVIGVGFGYVPSIDDYRIGCIFKGIEGMCHVVVYSLKNKDWEETACLGTDYDLLLDRRFFSVVIDETIYWPPRTHKNGEGNDNNHVVGLNLVSGQIEKIPLMDILRGYSDAKVLEMNGCLALTCIKYEDGCCFSSRDFDVLMYKKCGERNLWVRTFSIYTKGATNLLYIFETGKCLVAKVDSGQLKLMLHDPNQVISAEEVEKETVIWERRRRIFFDKDVADAWKFTESLISPFGTSDAENEDE